MSGAIERMTDAQLRKELRLMKGFEPQSECVAKRVAALEAEMAKRVEMQLGR
jgi:hypothetical protein